jgi:ABC-type sugar transport system permease subunit
MDGRIMTISISATRTRSARSRGGRRAAGTGLLMILPAIAGLAIFQYYPIVVAIIQSGQSFNPFTHAARGFIGLDNYATLLGDTQFRAAFVNTLGYVVLTLSVEIPLGLALAQLINSRLPARALLRNAVIAGLAASETVAVLVWNQLYDPTHGLFNAILDAIGVSNQDFLTSSGQALPSIVAMSAWKNVGLLVLIFLAGLQNVPVELQEAAALDGAGGARRYWHVTLPALRRHLAVAMFVSTIAGTRIFTPIILMTQGGPNDSTTNLTYYTYQQAFQYSSYGVAAAATVCLLGLLGLITIVQALALRERT